MDTIQKLFGFKNLQMDDITDEFIKKRHCRILHLSYHAEMPDCCPICGRRLYKHGVKKFTVEDTPLAGVPVRLEITIPRKRCTNAEEKHIWRPELPEINEHHKMTNRALMNLAEKSMRATFEDTALDYAISANTVKNAFVDFMKDNKEALRFKTPVFLGIDEIKIKHMGEITVITDLEHRTLFDLFLGYTPKELLDYFMKLPHREEIKLVCSDIYRPFEKAFSDAIPHAEWVNSTMLLHRLTACIGRFIHENNQKGRGYSFEVLRARTLYRNSNLRAIFEKGLIDTIGPVIPEDTPTFHFDAQNGEDEYMADDHAPLSDSRYGFSSCKIWTMRYNRK